jgi:hypothetical protein
MLAHPSIPNPFPEEVAAGILARSSRARKTASLRPSRAESEIWRADPKALERQHTGALSGSGGTGRLI